MVDARGRNVPGTGEMRAVFLLVVVGAGLVFLLKQGGKCRVGNVFGVGCEAGLFYIYLVGESE